MSTTNAKTQPTGPRTTIAVLGATGMVGSRVVAEAGARGHRVLALSRKPPSPGPGPGPGPGPYPDAPAPDVVPLAVQAEDPRSVHGALAAAGAAGTVDAVVLTVRTEPADEGFLTGVTRTVLDAAAQLGIRVLVVGGAGALRSPGEPELLVADNHTYVPQEFRAVAMAGVAQLRTCRAHAGADWAYLSPPAMLEPGERTGRYRRGTDTLLLDSRGSSRISAEDLAVAVVDELESPGTDRHFTLVRHDG